MVLESDAKGGLCITGRPPLLLEHRAGLQLVLSPVHIRLGPLLPSVLIRHCASPAIDLMLVLGR